MNNLIIVLTVASILLFIIVLLILIVKKPLHNVFYQNYHKDQLIRNKDTKNLKNSLYFTSGTTLSYIKKYIICKSGNDKFVIANYADKFDYIEFFIISYDKKNNPISVISCKEENVSYSSHVIPIPSNANSVNIIIGKVNDKIINTNVIKPIGLKTIRLYSLALSVLLFTGLFTVINIINLTLGGIYYNYIFESTEYIIMIVINIILPFILYLFNVKGLRKKNLQNRVGGVIEYDFL